MNSMFDVDLNSLAEAVSFTMSTNDINGLSQAIESTLKQFKIKDRRVIYEYYLTEKSKNDIAMGNGTSIAEFCLKLSKFESMVRNQLNCCVSIV